MKEEVKWSLDQAHSEMGFSIKHLMITNVKGTFRTFNASIYTTGKDFETAEIDLWIDVSSINTGDKKRDEHLKSADFFDVANHKEITFVSNTVGKPDADNNYELWGELTIKGITRNVKMNIESGGLINYPVGKEKAGFSVTGKIKRKDWGLEWNSAIETGGFVLGDEVSISCELELVNEGRREQVMKLDTALS